MVIASREPCWGGCLQGTDTIACGSTRSKNSRHFKSKFCDDCKNGMVVPATRVRVLTDHMAYTLENRRSVGVWTIASPMMHGFLYRIVNNTHDCFGDRLIIFETEPPSDIAWTPVDDELVDGNGMVQMRVCRGTVVPIHYVKTRGPKRARHAPLDAGSDTPTLCEVIVPSSMVAQFANEPHIKDEIPSPPPSPSSPPESPSLSETRKLRNRKSAAKSRIMKQRYIASLEQKVHVLSQTVHALTEENQFWKSLGIVRGDTTCPLVACEAFSPD